MLEEKRSPWLWDSPEKRLWAMKVGSPGMGVLENGNRLEGRWV
jgi:hypothetical protein